MQKSEAINARPGIRLLPKQKHSLLSVAAKLFWPAEKLAELADGPTLCHVRWQGQAICFVSSVNPIWSSVRNFSFTVLSAVNNKQTSVK
jgi:hypothetical protein